MHGDAKASIVGSIKLPLTKSHFIKKILWQEILTFLPQNFLRYIHFSIHSIHSSTRPNSGCFPTLRSRRFVSMTVMRCSSAYQITLSHGFRT